MYFDFSFCNNNSFNECVLGVLTKRLHHPNRSILRGLKVFNTQCVLKYRKHDFAKQTGQRVTARKTIDFKRIILS